MNNEPYGWVKNGEYVLYIEKPDSVFNYIPLYTHQYERPHNTVLVPCDKLAEMQAEIEALKALLVEEQDESFDRTASHMAGEYVSYKAELTDEEIEQVRVAIMGVAYWCADENMPEAYNAVKVCCGQVLGILDKAQEK